MSIPSVSPSASPSIASNRSSRSIRNPQLLGLSPQSSIASIERNDILLPQGLNQQDIMVSYLNATTDDEARSFLSQIGAQYLSPILTYIFREGKLAAIPMGDAAQAFMIASPRSDLVKEAVKEVFSASFLTGEPFIAKGSTTQSSLGFFGVVKVVFSRICKFIQELFQLFFCLCSSSNSSKVEHPQNEMVIQLKKILELICSPGADADLFRLHFQFLSTAEPQLHAKIAYMIFQEAQKSGEDVSDSQFGENYLKEHPLGEFVKKAIEGYIRELESSCLQVSG